MWVLVVISIILTGAAASTEPPHMQSAIMSAFSCSTLSPCTGTEPVCGTDGSERRTFTSYCHLVRHACTEPAIDWRMEAKGRCTSVPLSSISCAWVLTADPQCAKDFRGQTRDFSSMCHLVKAQHEEPAMRWRFEHRGRCSSTGSLTVTCPTTCTPKFDQVCAISRVYGNTHTFLNQCNYQYAVCHQPSAEWTFQHAGPCI